MLPPQNNQTSRENNNAEAPSKYSWRHSGLQLYQNRTSCQKLPTFMTEAVIILLRKSMYGFLYDNGFRQERVNHFKFFLMSQHDYLGCRWDTRSDTNKQYPKVVKYAQTLPKGSICFKCSTPVFFSFFKISIIGFII